MAQLIEIKRVEVGLENLTARVRIADNAPLMTSDDLEGTIRVYQLLPNIINHACIGDHASTFKDVMGDTEIAHLLEHVTVELLSQTPEADEVSSGRTFAIDGDDREYDIELSCPDDVLTVGALSSAVWIVDWAYGDASDPVPDIQATVSGLCQLVEGLGDEPERAYEQEVREELESERQHRREECEKQAVSELQASRTPMSTEDTREQESWEPETDGEGGEVIPFVPKGPDRSPEALQAASDVPAQKAIESSVYVLTEDLDESSQSAAQPAEEQLRSEKTEEQESESQNSANDVETTGSENGDQEAEPVDPASQTANEETLDNVSAEGFYEPHAYEEDPDAQQVPIKDDEHHVLSGSRKQYEPYADVLDAEYEELDETSAPEDAYQAEPEGNKSARAEESEPDRGTVRSGQMSSEGEQTPLADEAAEGKEEPEVSVAGAADKTMKLNRQVIQEEAAGAAGLTDVGTQATTRMKPIVLDGAGNLDQEASSETVDASNVDDDAPAVQVDSELPTSQSVPAQETVTDQGTEPEPSFSGRNEGPQAPDEPSSTDNQDVDESKAAGVRQDEKESVSDQAAAESDLHESIDRQEEAEHDFDSNEAGGFEGEPHEGLESHPQPAPKPDPDPEPAYPRLRRVR